MNTEVETSTTSANVKDISVNPSEFDRSRVVIHDPTTSSFNVGDMPIETTMSTGKYVDDEGIECDLYFAAPAQTCFGVNYVYDLQVKKEEQVPENAKGLQICYPMTSMQTIDKPTPQEKACMDMIDALWELAVEKGRQEAEREEPLIPAPSVSSCMAAEKRKKMDLFVKRPMEYPKGKDKKTLDTTKPKRMYVKLVTTGRGETLKAHTKFFGPGDVQKSALRFVDKRGIIEPCYKWEGIYWGAHGPASPHGASLRFKLVEANYTPQTSSSIPSHRMLGKNSAPVQEDDDDNYIPPRRGGSRGEEDGGESEDFAEPGSDDANPVQSLTSAVKKAAAKPAVRVAAKPAVRVAAKPVVRVTPKTATPVAGAKAKPAAKPAVSAASKPQAAAKPKPPVRKIAPPPPEPEETQDTEAEVPDSEPAEEEPVDE